MSLVLQQVPILVGDDISNIKPGRIYDDKRFHLKTQNRFFWPSIEPDNTTIKAMAKKLNKPVWIEMGLGPKSILPYVKTGKVKKLMVYDRRPWAKNLMSFAHNPDTYLMYSNLKEKFANETLTIEDMIVLRRMAGNITKYDQAAIALFLIDKCNGNANPYTSFESSLLLGGLADAETKTTSEWSSNFPLQMFHVIPSVIEAMRICVKVLRPMAKNIHIHINDPLPGTKIVDILLSLNNIGFSWSAIVNDSLLFHEVKRIAHIEEWDDSIIAFSSK